ncbi:sigma-B regulation protein RsbU (phosphoserine phosphatase) [Saccharothrix carnea]|uniref:Sigma-B regulation protein RsbU (Phosphoserine phosphatase) n=1 Tax=Saccharothrix carnea TaxID=1280637 RepID=A0A2P8I1K1_SACCR|nr:SpoIIE family protein phosphatase [Saccharothrix carnea]PSL52338.1 sigma-B regulation protein RsbU (phosphoserine phosphatase) [Saccharothrix carnea]
MRDREAFSALLEDSAEDLYENAPCGYLSTLPDGHIAKVNGTLLRWLGYEREQLVGRRRFADLLSVGGKLYHETHFAPLLRMQGEVGGVALEMVAADGTRLPVLVNSTVRMSGDGEPLLIRTTVFDASDRRAYERELLRARQEAERERDQIQRLATTLQRTLLPPVLPAVPGVETATHYHHASPFEVGGDFYDLFPLADGRWGLFLGDVCGKGANAAAVTSLTRYTLRSAAVYDPDPVAVLTNLNAVLNQEAATGFCTVAFGVLTVEPDRCTLTLAAGGHPPGLLLRADGTVEYVELPGGQLIGILPDAHIATTTLHLTPGDTFVLYTDGLVEARTGSDTRYSEEELLDFAATLPPVSAAGAVDALVGLLDRFGSGVEDDAAVLAIGVPAGLSGAGVTRAAAGP